MLGGASLINAESKSGRLSWRPLSFQNLILKGYAFRVVRRGGDWVVKWPAAFRVENAFGAAHTGMMVRWLKIVLIVSGIIAGWVTLGVLTFDDNIRVVCER